MELVTQRCRYSFRRWRWCVRAGASFMLAFAVALATRPSEGQTFTILHSFADAADGGNPLAGLTIDSAGDLYGTASQGGFPGRTCIEGCGTIFMLTRQPSGWSFAPLYAFKGSEDGDDPQGRVAFGPNRSPYATTSLALDPVSGTVMNLKPPSRPCPAIQCPWTETLIFQFNSVQGFGTNNIVFDQSGIIYGTMDDGSNSVYKLTPSGDSWTETVLHTFSGGSSPSKGVILDTAGNLYGNAYLPTSGIVFEITNPGGQYIVLHKFNGSSDGFDPLGGLIFDGAGNLYGGTLCGGANGEGTIYKLSRSQNGWALAVLYNFAQGDANYCGGPFGQLTMDAAGNLYGTTHSGGAYHFGSVFKLAPSEGGWIYTSLHDFCSGGLPCVDGGYPFSNVVIDSSGNLYGTASLGGAYAYKGLPSGVIWEITP